MRALVGVVVGAVLVVMVLGAGPAIVVGAVLGAAVPSASAALSASPPSSASSPANARTLPGPGPAAAAVSEVPAPMLALYERAARVCPGLSWSVLAAIGTVESANGTSELPGVHAGANFAGAEGPMQFEPPTFALYDRPVPPGGANPPSPYDAVDAVYAAARDLCANGAAVPAHLPDAVFAYNHSQTYVNTVLRLAERYAS